MFFSPLVVILKLECVICATRIITKRKCKNNDRFRTLSPSFIGRIKKIALLQTCAIGWNTIAVLLKVIFLDIKYVLFLLEMCSWLCLKSVNTVALWCYKNMFVFSTTNSNISSTNGMSLGLGCMCLPTNGRQGESLNKIFHECFV